MRGRAGDEGAATDECEDGRALGDGDALEEGPAEAAPDPSSATLDPSSTSVAAEESLDTVKAAPTSAPVPLDSMLLERRPEDALRHLVGVTGTPCRRDGAWTPGSGLEKHARTASAGAALSQESVTPEQIASTPQVELQANQPGRVRLDFLWTPDPANSPYILHLNC